MKRGIPARELRPYSMEDPRGLGIESPSQHKLKERFHRKVDKKRTSGRKTPEHSVVSPPAVRERRPAPAGPPPTPKATAKKSSGWGCLVTLAVIGIVWALGQVFVPLIVGAIRQELVLHTGNEAYGRILKTEVTDIHLNESTVYELTVEVHVPGQPVYQVDFEQALEKEQAAEARPGAWSTLRYDAQDRNNIVLKRLGVDPPTTDQMAPDAFLQLDIRAITSTSTQLPSQDAVDGRTASDPNSAQLDSNARAPSPDRRGVAPPNGSTPGAAAPARSPVAGPSPAESPSPAANPTPAPAAKSASVTPAATPEESTATASPATILPACRRAAACCTLAGGSSCGQFVTPGKEKRECSRAYSAFSKQATAAGSSCK